MFVNTICLMNYSDIRYMKLSYAFQSLPQKWANYVSQIKTHKIHCVIGGGGDGGRRSGICWIKTSQNIFSIESTTGIKEGCTL